MSQVATSSFVSALGQKTPRKIRWPDWRRTKLSPKHRLIYKSNARKMIVNAGRAFGKDHILFLRCIRIMFQLYAERCIDQNWTRYGPRVLVGVYAPVANNFEQLWDRFKEMLPQIPGVAPGGGPQIKTYEKKGAYEVEIFGPLGIKITFFSVFKGDSTRGNGFDILLGTEVAFGKERTLTHSLFKLVFRPHHAGICMLNSSPMGQGSWWDKAIAKCRKKKGFWKDWELHEGCYVDNAMATQQDHEEAQAAKEKNIYTYRRENLGWIGVPDVPDEVVDAEGVNLAFTPEEVDALLVTQKIHHVGPYYAGSDLAYSGDDPAVTIVLDGPTGLIVDIRVLVKGSDEELIRHLEETQKKWRPVKHSYDANGPLTRKLEGRLRALNLNPIVTTRELVGENSKAEQVKHTKNHFLHGTVKIPNPEVYRDLSPTMIEDLWKLIIETRAYRKFELVRDVQEGGRVNKKVFVTFGKPVDGTDDYFDALNYLLQGREITTSAALPLAAHEIWS